jgi:hypothetical protein
MKNEPIFPPWEAPKTLQKHAFKDVELGVPS